MGKRVEKNNSIFQYRLEKHHDELRWLYMELYQNDDMFAELCSKMYEYYRQRSSKLKERDAKREQEAGWSRLHFIENCTKIIEYCTKFGKPD